MTTQNPQRPYPPVRRRRRRRRSIWPLYAVNILLLVLAGVQLIRTNVIREESGPLLPRADASAYGQDVTAPVIAGVKDLTVSLGEAVSYLNHVTVTDDQDPAPRLNVDSSQVDLTREGVYTITYTAQDAAGNQSAAFALVTVAPAQQAEPTTDQETEQVVKGVLDQIITPQMSTREQVQAIYGWAKENLRYGGHTDRSGVTQGGYEMLTTGQGDCYGYFAATKLLLDSLGIPNIDVEKLQRSDSDSEHFWSLVSVDGGKTYYHFDATPRVGQTEELCLVTDMFLASFDTYHDGCHFRDKSAYPATPEGWV